MSEGFVKRGYLIMRSTHGYHLKEWKKCVRGTLSRLRSSQSCRFAVNARRWFVVLRDSTLMFYKTPNDLRPKGEITLFGAGVVFADHAKVDRPTVFCLEVVCSTQTLYLCGDVVSALSLRLQRPALCRLAALFKRRVALVQKLNNETLRADGGPAAVGDCDRGNGLGGRASAHCPQGRL